VKILVKVCEVMLVPSFRFLGWFTHFLSDTVGCLQDQRYAYVLVLSLMLMLLWYMLEACHGIDCACYTLVMV